MSTSVWLSSEDRISFSASVFSTLCAPTKFVPLFVRMNLVQNPVEHKNLLNAFIKEDVLKSAAILIHTAVVTMHTNTQSQRFRVLLPTTTLKGPAKSEAAYVNACVLGFSLEAESGAISCFPLTCNLSLHPKQSFK